MFLHWLLSISLRLIWNLSDSQQDFVAVLERQQILQSHRGMQRERTVQGDVVWFAGTLARLMLTILDICRTWQSIEYQHDNLVSLHAIVCSRLRTSFGS